MKVLAINGSPHMDRGNTALILNPFLEGMGEAGADVELLYTGKMDIKPCRGCFGCWTKTPGKCVQKDDMETLLPKLRDAEVWVLATPVYFDAVSGPLKNMIDRLTPFLRLPAEVRDGRSRHVVEDGHQDGKVVLVANCGLWEMGNFDPLVVQMKAACKHVEREFVGALLRPHGGTLRDLAREGHPVDDVYDAAREAGRQLVIDGELSPDILSIVGRELVSLDEYVENMNQLAEQLLGPLEGSY
jgi:multimeric flavodoxin WrbA